MKELTRLQIDEEDARNAVIIALNNAGFLTSVVQTDEYDRQGRGYGVVIYKN